MKNRSFLKMIVILVFVMFAYWQTFSQNRSEVGKQDAYIIGPKDLLSITVFGASDLNTRARISESGEITLPLVGIIKLGGLTRVEAEKSIEKLLDEKYLKNARVSVFIEEYRSRTISVSGAVTNSGDQELIGEQSLLQIISRAGGLTEAAAGKIIILREINDKKTSRIIDIAELMGEGEVSLNIKILAGDIINIPRVHFLNVYVFGQVRNPGNHRIRISSRGGTLLKVIAHAGGFTERARRGGVLITRSTKAGPKRIKVSVKNILKGKKRDIVLKQDDVIYVPESLF